MQQANKFLMKPYLRIRETKLLPLINYSLTEDRKIWPKASHKYDVVIEDIFLESINFALKAEVPWQQTF